MFEDKTLKCVECGNEFIFPHQNRNFMRRKVLPMNRNAALPAVLPVRPV